ncbi:MAG: hypothetical protein PUF46_02230, partial [Oscillospiraceae bacterium]|nr:hypothetical protein [Oscillospiraceae bacterium]
MKRDVTQQATEYSRSHRRKKRWQQVMTGLAAVVVFCTTYALILPAITLEEPVCGLEEHAHTEACYTQVTSVEELELVCAEPVHVHDDTCYETVQTLICPLEDENHQHDESCYETTVQLICEQPEHEHTDACYETVTVPVDTKTLTCTIPEDENHTHTALCYGTWELTCGQEAHEHTEACYAAETDYSAESDPEADLETQTDWEATLEDVSLTGEYRQDVLAVAESQLGYQESLRNYMTDDNGICRGYSRYGAWYGDPYGDWSAMYAAFCLSYAQVEGMTLNSDCAAWAEALSAEDCGLYFPAEDYEPVPGDLIFFSTDGTGTPDRVGLVTARIAAVGDTPEQLRVIGGDSENRVRYETYTLSDETIAGYAALPEQTFVCGREGHVHTAFCYDSHGNVTCGKEEHIHTDICEAADAEQAELLFTGPDYTITVRYGTDAAFPEGVTLTAEEILPDSDAYQTYLDQTLQLLEAETAEQVLFARFFDIRFLTDSGEVEPAAPVEVTITYAETVDTPEPANCQAVHFAGDGAELLDAQTQTPEEGTTSFTHVQETFSVTGDVVSVAADYNSTDVGPNSLPVDYYVCIDGTWTCVGSTKTGWYSNRQNGEESLTNYNRDYITVAQAVSILGPYGFTGNEENPSRVTAYQQKSGHTKIYSDTDTVTVPQGEDSGTKILPLSVNGDHAGYNIYYLPNNSKNISAITSPDSLDKSANGFYTVTVYDAQGIVLTKSDPIFTGGSFTYDASANGTTNWLVAYGSGSTSTVTGSTITLSNITSTVTVSPSRGTTTSHSVTFKVMIDGQWQTVGSLPYYYSGTVNGSQRAYITSDMAAQFFGDFGYTAATAPEYHFGYSYNDIYEIYYANGTAKTNFCMDVNGGTIKEAQTVQLYTSNHSA